MTFFGKLKDHEGGLIRIKTKLYWIVPERWVDDQEKICLLLSVGTAKSYHIVATDGRDKDCYLHLLIDGRPAWIGLNKQSFEIIK